MARRRTPSPHAVRAGGTLPAHVAGGSARAARVRLLTRPLPPLPPRGGGGNVLLLRPSVRRLVNADPAALLRGRFPRREMLALEPGSPGWGLNATLAAVARSAAVVGPHGAHMAHILAAPPRTPVAEVGSGCCGATSCTFAGCMHPRPECPRGGRALPPPASLPICTPTITPCASPRTTLCRTPYLLFHTSARHAPSTLFSASRPPLSAPAPAALRRCKRSRARQPSPERDPRYPAPKGTLYLAPYLPLPLSQREGAPGDPLAGAQARLQRELPSSGAIHGGIHPTRGDPTPTRFEASLPRLVSAHGVCAAACGCECPPSGAPFKMTP